MTVAPKGATNAKAAVANAALRQARLTASPAHGPHPTLPRKWERERRPGNQGCIVPVEIYLNVAVSGLLTGLVYGLMALGLSVIFGVVRVVNFAHGEMMTIAMYLAVVLFAAFKLDPLLGGADRGRAVRARLRDAGGLINPFIDRPEHSQFILLVAIAMIIVNGLLIVFGPDARNVQTVLCVRGFANRSADRRCDKVYAGRRRARGGGRAVRLLPLRAARQGDPRLRRQLHRRARGRPRRQAALCAHLRARRRLRRRRRRHDGAAGRCTPPLARPIRCSPSSS